ncbi:MAG: DUF2079 domain-containing protein [Anaerolineae bacterium]|nr:DUF2079 domain-containing protein [Anaerolineae bacterium]
MSFRLYLTPARILLSLLMLVYFVYFGLYANQRHLAFETGAFDTGVYAQPLWNFIQGRGFAVSLIKDNGPLRWATHVEPILFLIAPLYKLWPHPRTLFWLQTAGLTLAAWPLYALAVQRLQNEWAALTMVAAYFLLPATEAVTLFDFHAVAFAPLFLLAAFYFLEQALTIQGKSLWLWPEKKQLSQAGEPATNGAAAAPPFFLLLTFYFLAGLFFMLAMSTKEDISLYVFMIGLYLLALRRCWREGGVLMGAGLVWFYVTFQVIIPAYRTGGGHSIYAAWFETLGHTPLDIALSPFTKPGAVLALLFQPGSLPALSMLTLPLLLLPLLGFPFLLMAAPGFAFIFLSQNPTLRQLETWHYAAPMLAFVMLATVDGMARVGYWWRGAKSNVLRLTLHPSRFALPLLSILLLIASFTYHVLRGYSPLSLLSEWSEVTRHHQLGRELAALIPEESSVLAQAQLVPYVAHRYQLAIWNGPLDTDYDYIWLDLSHPKLPNRFNAQGELLTGLVIEEAFGPIAAKDGYLLLKKGAARIPISEELFSFTKFDQLPANAQPFDAVFGDTLKLVGVKPDAHRLATSETEPQVVLYFETLQKPGQDYNLFVYLLDERGMVIGATDYAQPAIFWWPTSRWAVGDRRQVRVNTIPWWTGDKSRFSYALGFSHSNDPWDESVRLPVIAGPHTPPPLENQTLLPIAAFRRFGGLVYPAALEIIKR